jgi:hypothetical protein
MIPEQSRQDSDAKCPPIGDDAENSEVRSQETEES